MHEESKPVYGEPERWQFDYPWEWVKLGFWLWSMSGFQRLPTQSEVGEYDQRWIDDIKLAHWIYAHQGNKTQLMSMLENFEAFEKDPAAWQAAQEELRKQATSKGADNKDVTMNSKHTYRR